MVVGRPRLKFLVKGIAVLGLLQLMIFMYSGRLDMLLQVNIKDYRFSK